MSTTPTGGFRPETLPMISLPVCASPVISQVPATTSEIPIDPMAATVEHILASLARFEAKLEEVDRRTAGTQTIQRPDPDPPYDLPLRGTTAAAMPRIQPSSSVVVSIPTIQYTAPLQFGSVPFGHAPRFPTSTTEWLGNSATSQAQNTVLGYGTQDHRNPNGPILARTNPDGSFGYSRPQFGPSFSAPRTASSWDPPPEPSSWDKPAPRQSWEHPTPWENPPYRHGSSATDHNRSFKMDPPHFDGSEVTSWISRVQYYFEHIGMAVDHRLHYVVMLFDPPVADWVFNYRENNPHAKWSDFLEDVRRRFDPKCFVNYMELIAKLCQKGALSDYNNEFEGMMNRLRGVPKYILLPIYVGGLQQPVRNQVKFQYPPSVAAAMALALEFDSALDRPSSNSQFQRRPWQQRESRQPGGLPPPPPSTGTSAVPLQGKPNGTRLKGSEFSGLKVMRLTSAEKAEPTRLGLCWYCPEKWASGHVCKQNFLAYMGVDEDDEDELAPPDQQPSAEVITADISHLYAMGGRPRSDAIELVGSIAT